MIRYKKILDNKNKTGRGRQQWEFFNVMDDVCGRKASSVSLRGDLTEPTTSVDTVTSVLAADTASSSPTVTAISTAVTASSTTIISSKNCNRKRKNSKNSAPPKWWCDAEASMNKAQEEWRNELRQRLDRQEQLQVERLQVMTRATDLLDKLVAARSVEN